MQKTQMMNKFEITKPGKYEYQVVVDDIGQDKELLGIVRADKEGDYEINIVSQHKVGETKCRVDVKGIVSNGARVAVS